MHQQQSMKPRGRRANRVVAPTVMSPVANADSPRRFAGTSRYGVAADLEALLALAPQAEAVEAGAPAPVRATAVAAPLEEAPARTASNVIDFETRSARRSKNAHAARKLGGYATAIGNIPQRAAVAAASAGLVALLLAPGQSPKSEDDVVSIERAAQSLPAVNDVVAPAVPQTVAHVQAQAVAPETLAEILESAGGPLNLTPEQKLGLLAHPVNPVRITSPFGNRPDPWGGNKMVGHVGQDYATTCGQPVYATAPGTVVQAESAGHSGLRVTIDHGFGLETAYSHNTALKVSVGDEVDTGDLIALSGTTGNSTGCHVHYEVIIDGEFVDPADWVGRQ